MGSRWSYASLGMFMLSGCSDVLGLDEYEEGSGGGGSSDVATASGAGGSTSSITGGMGGSTCASNYATKTIERGPAAYWRLGELTPGRLAHNEMPSGDLYDGILLENVTVGHPGLLRCDRDTAMRIDSPVGSRIEVNDGLDFIHPAPFSIEVWVHVANLEYGSIVRKVFDPTSIGYQIWYNPEGLRFRMLNGALETEIAIANFTVGSTYHIVATYDGATMCLYLNADRRVCEATQVQLADTTEKLLLGRSMIGLLDEVAIYPRALSEQEIQEQYQAGVQPL